MENHNLIGKIVQDEQVRYRIIHYHQEQFVLCQLDVSQLNLQYCSAETLYRKIRNKNLEITEDHDCKIIDFDQLSEKQKMSFPKRKAFVSAIEKAYGPSFMKLIGKSHKAVFCDICNQYNVSRCSAWKYIRIYLQSGFNDCSLLDHRASSLSKRSKDYEYHNKPGRRYPNRAVVGVALTAEHQKNLDFGFHAYKKGRETTFKNAYIALLAKFYRQSIGPDGQYILKPSSEMPTYRQFVHYCNKRLTAEEKRVLKTSLSEERNNHRLLTGKSSTNVNCPGDVVEIDALEVDCSLVSEYNPSQCVGRPILYTMIDCYSKSIVAFSLSFENNSEIGITNLFLNLADNKKDFCQKYNYSLNDESCWPSNFTPRQIRCDRGAEARSDRLSTICKRLGIARTLVTGGSGSLKGLVEKSFDQFQKPLRPELEGRGLITKRHDSRHHQQATYTLKEMTRLVIAFVIAHNMRALSQNYLSKDMMTKITGPRNPINIWNYGCDKMGLPHMIQPGEKNQYLYNLMTEETATISRHGIFVKGLYYSVPDDEILFQRISKLMNKKEKIAVRVDPRYVGAVYYCRDNTLFKAPLNAELSGDEQYANMTLSELKKFYEIEKEKVSREERYNLELDTAHRIIREQILGTKKPSGDINTQNMRTTRSVERARTNFENRIENHIEEPCVEPRKSIPKNVEEDVSPVPVKKPTNIFEAIDQFYEQEEEDFDDV